MTDIKERELSKVQFLSQVLNLTKVGDVLIKQLHDVVVTFYVQSAVEFSRGGYHLPEEILEAAPRR